jgi:predicted Zn finger-like uncharacterized protein
MIIPCNNCFKKFELDSNLIPVQGRLLQCNSCNHKWFFKKIIINKPIKSSEIEKEETISFFDNSHSIESDIDNKTHENQGSISEETKSTNESLAKPNKQRSYKVLNLLVVALISFVAFIIALDTFKSPLGNIVPSIEYSLYNLYESLIDITLFFKDLF